MTTLIGATRQDDDPYRSHAKPYVCAMAIAMRQFGRVEVLANVENLLDVRQTKYQPLGRPAPAVGAAGPPMCALRSNASWRT